MDDIFGDLLVLVEGDHERRFVVEGARFVGWLAQAFDHHFTICRMRIDETRLLIELDSLTD